MALWIRSHHYDERICKTNDGMHVSVGVGYGTLAILRLTNSEATATPAAWHVERRPLTEETAFPMTWFVSYTDMGDGERYLLVSLWLIVFVALICAASPWGWAKYRKSHSVSDSE